MAFQVDLVSPEGTIFSAEADMVVARTSDGDVAFQTGHVPFIGVLESHRVKVFVTDGTEQLIAVHRGFVEVAGDHVTILSDTAELAEHLDADRALAAFQRAEEELARNIEAGPDVVADKIRAQTRLLVIDAFSGN